jgi:hypothetical protein
MDYPAFIASKRVVGRNALPPQLAAATAGANADDGRMAA